MVDPEQEPLESPATADIIPEESSPAVIEGGSEQPLIVAEVQPPLPRREVFPPWAGWDVAAVLCFTLAAVFLFSTVALGVAHILSSARHVSWGDLASSPIVVIGSQVAAYPIVIAFMIVLVRAKSRELFWQASRWN